MSDANEARVLQPGPIRDLSASERKVLREMYRPIELEGCVDVDRLLAENGASVSVIATDGHVGASAELMEKLPNLKAVVCFGAGVDQVDLNYAKMRGIRVSNTPGVLNDDVANLGIGLMLACSRNLVAADAFVRKGEWKNGTMPLQKGIRGKKVGILGLGGIGKDLAGKLEVFGCDIAYHGRREQDNVDYPYFGELIEMARWSDFLFAICPANQATRKIVNRAVLDALGAEGVFINIARGAVVDEEALVAALVEGRLGGAGLDVFENEPNVSEALLGMDNVVLIPHMGSATVDTRRAMGKLMLKNLSLFFEGKPFETPLAF